MSILYCIRTVSESDYKWLHFGILWDIVLQALLNPCSFGSIRILVILGHAEVTAGRMVYACAEREPDTTKSPFQTIVTTITILNHNVSPRVSF